MPKNWKDMSKGCRSIARMRLIDGLQYKEIAEELGMELNTVRTRIRRAKAIIESMKAED